MSERIKLNPKAQKIINEVSDVGLVRGFHGHCKGRNLGDYLKRYLLPSMAKDIKEGVISVPIIVGYPGNGKSWLLRKINRLIDVTFPKLKKTDGRDTLTFEGDGLRPARAAGFILTGPEDEREDEEIGVAGGYARWGMREILRRPGIKVVTAELPYVTQLTDDFGTSPKVIGLDSGTSAVNQLFESDAGSRYNLPPFRVYLIGQIGGQILRRVSRQSREEIKSASTLKEARAIAKKYKKRPPRNEEELQILRLEGASSKTMEKYRRRLSEVALEMRKRRIRISSHPAQLSEEVFRKQERAVQDSLRNIAPENIGDPIAAFMNHPYLNMLQETRIFYLLFTTLKRASIGVLGPGFVCLNDPGSNELMVG